ncbi:MAG: hypothetical protein PHG66_00490 [Candidatus Colwellbacteria bacterium]|nr:hypothetical protein [Candidatus Colwellbacteria bacterium]
MNSAQSLRILDDIGLSTYRDLQGISDSETGDTLNALLFDQTMRYYKDRLDVSIIIPKLPTKPTRGMIMSFFGSIKTKVYDSFNKDAAVNILDDTDSTKYFGDFITTDVLDGAITEIPIETQLLKEETCSELSGINSRIVGELKEFMKMDEELGSTAQKRKLKDELEEKIKAQEEILSIIRNRDL